MSLYSDRTFENLQEEYLTRLNNKQEQLPENQRLDLSEGSFLYMACAKQAIRLEEAYNDLDDVNDNMLVDTQDLEHLIDSGFECGIPIMEGTPALVTAELNCECPLRAEFSAIDSDYNYRAVKLSEIIDNEDGSKTYRYLMDADDIGADPGNYRGEIEPEDYLEGFEIGRVISTVIAGTEQEEESAYRLRRLSSYSSRACAGNREYYLEELGKIRGVGGVKIFRRQQGQNTIPCYIQAEDYGVPSAELMAEIQERSNPEGLEGEGAGICPFGHILDLHPVEGVVVNVSASFTFDDGYSFGALKTAMENAITEYITELASAWQDSGSIVVRRVMVETKLVAITGILDIADLQLNGGDDNVITTDCQIPVFGEITEAV